MDGFWLEIRTGFFVVNSNIKNRTHLSVELIFPLIDIYEKNCQKYMLIRHLVYLSKYVYINSGNFLLFPRRSYDNTLIFNHAILCFDF